MNYVSNKIDSTKNINKKQKTTPVEMPNYQLGKIYKIISDQTDQIYIGSTTMPRLSQRLAQHRADYEKFQAGKVKCSNLSSFQIIRYHDYSIVLVEIYPCHSKDELHAREQHWIETTQNCINKVKAFTGQNKEEYMKQYNQQYRETHLESLKTYISNYYKENSDRVKGKVKEYKQKNIDAIKAKKYHKLICECGIQCMKTNYSQHLRSLKHISYEKSKLQVNECGDHRNQERETETGGDQNGE